MDQEQLEAIAPQFRESYKEVAGLKVTQYIREEDLLLSKTADNVLWEPPVEIYDLIDFKNIQVVLLDRTTDFDKLLSRFIEMINVGLVLMGPNISRRKKPAIIVLTTKESFYAVDPEFRRGIQFLQDCLTHKSLKIWTTNGFHESNCLLYNFGISLFNSQAKDCLGMHLQLMKLLKCLPDFLPKDSTIYPKRAIDYSHRTLRLESFEKLLYVWLGIENSNSLECDTSQLAHLYKRPLNLTAINLIKKRCLLVLKLAEALVYYSEEELRIMNRNVLESLSAKDEIASETMRKYTNKCEKEKIANFTYFAHLQNGANE